jgi:hypothetical protein
MLAREQPDPGSDCVGAIACIEDPPDVEDLDDDCRLVGRQRTSVPHNLYAAPRIRDSYISFIPRPTERGTEPMYT